MGIFVYVLYTNLISVVIEIIAKKYLRILFQSKNTFHQSTYNLLKRSPTYGKYFKYYFVKIIVNWPRKKTEVLGVRPYNPCVFVTDVGPCQGPVTPKSQPKKNRVFSRSPGKTLIWTKRFRLLALHIDR